MTSQHPITPSPDLIEEWVSMLEYHPDEKVLSEVAQWGADQELEACVEWVRSMFGGHPTWADELRTARRPKPPSLKEQALAALSEADQGLNESEWQQRSDTIRRALETLND